MPPGGATFQGQRSILRSMVVPSNAQTTWGTPVALAALQAGVGLHFDVSGFAKITPTTESTYGQAGSGNSFASNNWQTSVKTADEISGFLTDYLAGWLLAFAMGKDTVTGAGPYSHAFNFLDTTTVAQATTIYRQDTADIYYQLVDMGISQLVISSTSTGALKFKASLIGTGRYINGSLAGMPAPIAAPQYLFGSDAQFGIGPTAGGAPASFFPRVNNWEITIDTGIQPVYASGGGQFAAYLSVAMPKIKLKAAIAASNVSDVRVWQLARTPLTIALSIASGASSLAFNFPNVILVNCDLGDSSGNAEWTLNFDETNILQVGATPLVTATVINGQASYLTAA